MTLKEMYHNSDDWCKKCIIIETFHFMRSLRNRSWRLEDTARELEISKALVCEDLKLAKALNTDASLKELSRNKALIKVRTNGE